MLAASCPKCLALLFFYVSASPSHLPRNFPCFSLSCHFLGHVFYRYLLSEWDSALMKEELSHSLEWWVLSRCLLAGIWSSALIGSTSYRIPLYHQVTLPIHWFCETVASSLVHRHHPFFSSVVHNSLSNPGYIWEWKEAPFILMLGHRHALGLSW